MDRPWTMEEEAHKRIRAQHGFDRLLIRPSLTAAKQLATPPLSPTPVVILEEASTTSNAQPEKKTEVTDVPPAAAAQGSTAQALNMLTHDLIKINSILKTIKQSNIIPSQ
jgi:hypothetical protein